MRRFLFLLLTLSFAAAAAAAEPTWCLAATNAAGRYAAVDWGRAAKIRPGVRGVWLSVATPRPMKAYLLRCDLNRFDFAATRRSPDFGHVWKGSDGRTFSEGTRRETTGDWIRRNPEVVVAANASPWDGGVGGGSGPLPADPNGLCMTYGDVLSDHPCWTNVSFVVRKDGPCDILCTRPSPEERGGLLHCFMGYGVFLKDGQAIGARDAQHPRTAYGLSRDRRWLYFLAVDGRQPTWSHGADNHDLAMLMLAAGASDGINLDGGGSTSLWVRPAGAADPVQLNRHDPQRLRQRAVAINFGLVEKAK